MSMILKSIWYQFVKIYVKIGLFFYFKKIVVVGKKNIPKTGAILFVVNHPNGLIDPLLVATNTHRTLHYLVRAAAFKKPILQKLFATLNLMPIFRLQDGIKNLDKNEQIFEKCFHILQNEKALVIFPEGTHSLKRTVRPLSKGFTRIIFGAFEKNPNLKIQIIPVGITYQNPSFYPTKVAVHFGKPILANTYYNKENIHESTLHIKSVVSKKLERLCVHIPKEVNYNQTLTRLVKNNTDFTKVNSVNKSITNQNFNFYNTPKNRLKPLYFLLIITNFMLWLIWKKMSKKVTETEFVDTFRFTIAAILFPIMQILQTLIIYFLCNIKIALVYGITNIIFTLVYTKLATNRLKLHLE